MARLGRILIRVLLGIVALVVVIYAGLWLNTQRVLAQRFDNPVSSVKVAVTPERVARGAYLVTAFPGCASCHSSDPTAKPPVLDGGYMPDLQMFGDFHPPNLTPGGRLKDWSDGEIIRAIREGISRDGRPLSIMPSGDFHSLSDEDVQAIVAYLRSQPAVQKQESAAIQANPLGILLFGTGLVQPQNQPPAGTVTAPPRGATAAYGSYLRTIAGCATCHGPNLDGQNPATGAPQGPSLRVVKGWTEEQFLRTLRQGIDPTNHQLDPTRMPWQQYGQGTDGDLLALYAYLKSLP